MHIRPVVAERGTAELEANMQLSVRVWAYNNMTISLPRLCTHKFRFLK